MASLVTRYTDGTSDLRSRDRKCDPAQGWCVWGPFFQDPSTPAAKQRKRHTIHRDERSECGHTRGPQEIFAKRVKFSPFQSLFIVEGANLPPILRLRYEESGT